MKLTSKQKYLINKTKKQLGVKDNYYIDKRNNKVDLVYIKYSTTDSMDKLYRVNISGDN